jgi:hypothetical protein
MPVFPVLLFAAAAQVQAAAPPPPTRHWGRLFVSPMGEPFHGNHGEDALAAWFTQADSNHDGFLTVGEVQADAERFFGLLDVNHDGEIDPDEITRYEDMVAMETSRGRLEAASGDAVPTGAAGGDTGGFRGGHRGAENFQRPGQVHQGAARFGLLDLPEPVISADENFNRGVSLSEFRSAAAHRFVALDLDHQGKLTLAGLENIRPAPSAVPNKPQSSGGDDVPPPIDHYPGGGR